MIMTNKEIRQYVPHRYPFLLVDKVIACDLETALPTMVAIKNVTTNEPFFVGHFPGEPVMPGVLMIEALAQTMGLLMGKILNWGPNHGNLCVLAGVDKARFKRMVLPGDQLTLQVSLIKHRRDLWKFSGEARVEGELACSADILVSGVSR
jgi:3-hydroxyacyl-[acyl-carrier-protein] dehydratase